MSAIITLGRAQCHVSDVAEPQAGLINLQVADFLDGCEFAAGPDTEPLVTGRDLTGTDRKIGLHELVVKIGNVDSVGLQLRRLEQDTYLARVDALQLHT